MARVNRMIERMQKGHDPYGGPNYSAWANNITAAITDSDVIGAHDILNTSRDYYGKFPLPQYKPPAPPPPPPVPVPAPAPPKPPPVPAPAPAPVPAPVPTPAPPNPTPLGPPVISANERAADMRESGMAAEEIRQARRRRKTILTDSSLLESGAFATRVAGNVRRKTLLGQ